jgi:hypothetical protein
LATKVPEPSKYGGLSMKLQLIQFSGGGVIYSYLLILLFFRFIFYFYANKNKSRSSQKLLK